VRRRERLGQSCSRRRQSRWPAFCETRSATRPAGQYYQERSTQPRGRRFAFESAASDEIQGEALSRHDARLQSATRAGKRDLRVWKPPHHLASHRDARIEMPPRAAAGNHDCEARVTGWCFPIHSRPHASWPPRLHSDTRCSAAAVAEDC
jgi:hypothetical protein